MSVNDIDEFSYGMSDSHCETAEANVKLSKVLLSTDTQSDHEKSNKIVEDKDRTFAGWYSMV